MPPAATRPHVPSTLYLAFELLFARRDRGRHTNRIKGLLASQGVPLARIRELPTHLARARLWDGSPLPPLLCARLDREWETVRGYTIRIRALKKERRQRCSVQPMIQRLLKSASSTNSAASASTVRGSTSWSSSLGGNFAIAARSAASRA